jgi:hypothetical protein
MLKIQADDPFAFDVIFVRLALGGKKGFSEKKARKTLPFSLLLARLHSFYCSFLVHLANAQIRV